MLKKSLSGIKPSSIYSSTSPFWSMYNNRNPQILPKMPIIVFFKSLSIGHTNGPQLMASWEISPIN